MRDAEYPIDARQPDREELDVRSRRLQLIVYSAMVAFVVLAVYGFWLITSLTRDVSRLAVEVSTMTRTIDREMAVMALKMGDIDQRMMKINDSMHQMNQNISTMTIDVGTMAASVQGIGQNISSMASDTTTMAGSTLNMQRDMWSLNRNVSGPLGIVNAFNPFGGFSPFPGAPMPFFPQH
jgi:uncharacterized protein YoxC